MTAPNHIKNQEKTITYMCFGSAGGGGVLQTGEREGWGGVVARDTKDDSDDGDHDASSCVIRNPYDTGLVARDTNADGDDGDDDASWCVIRIPYDTGLADRDTNDDVDDGDDDDVSYGFRMTQV